MGRGSRLYRKLCTALKGLALLFQKNPCCVHLWEHCTNQQCLQCWQTDSNLSKTSANITTRGKLHRSKSLTSNQWRSCLCYLVLFIFMFIIFWCVIIFYASRRDIPIDVIVSDDFKMPEIQPKYNDMNPRVPLLFHQLWKSKTIPEKWKAAHKGCLEMNSEYKLVLWTDEMIYNFIYRHYPWFYRMFLNYPYHIQRVDVARYFLLYHYGGVYLDMDAACKTPFRDIVKVMTEDESVLLPMTDIYGITNSFMVSQPKSEFFKFVIYELPNFAYGAYNLVRHTTIIFSTGPMFMSHCAKTFSNQEEIHVMPLEDYNDKHFAHIKSGSWHGMDTEIVDIFHFHYVALLIVVCVFVFIVVACCRRRGSPVTHFVD